MRLLALFVFATVANACFDETSVVTVAPNVVTPKLQPGAACAIPASVVNTGSSEFDELVRIEVPRFTGVTHDFANVEFRGHDGNLLTSWAGPVEGGTALFTVQMPRVPQGTSYFIVDACDREAAVGRRTGATAADAGLTAQVRL